MYLAFDIETNDNDILTTVPLQLGWALYDESLTLVEREDCLIRWPEPPEMGEWSRDNLPAHLLRNAGVDIATARILLRTALRRHTQKQVIIIGHNFAGFDYPVLRRYWTREQWNEMFNYRMIDTAVVGRFMADTGMIPKSGGLSTYLEEFGINNPFPHDAGWDAVSEGTLYKMMVARCLALLGS